MARIGEQGMLLCAVNNQLRTGAGKGNPWWMVDSCAAKMGEQGVLLCAEHKLLKASWWMVDSCMARVGEKECFFVE